MNAQRSGCPINLTVETLGDRWSLIVIRDLMFGSRVIHGGKRRYLAHPTRFERVASTSGAI